MNNKTPSIPLLLRAVLLITCFMMAILVNSTKAGDLRLKIQPLGKVDVLFKQWPNDKKKLTIYLTATLDTHCKMFIFSADGILMNDLQLTTNSTKTINGLSRGFYTFELFDNDLRMKSGSLVIQ